METCLGTMDATAKAQYEAAFTTTRTAWTQAAATPAGKDGLKKAVLEHPEMFVSTATEKLLTYALGRGLEAYDAAAIRKIVRDARASNYRFSNLVLGVVNSTPFQMRRSQ